MIAELDADLLKDRVGVVLDQREGFLIERLVRRDLADGSGRRRGCRRGPCCSSGSRAASAAARAPASTTLGGRRGWVGGLSARGGLVHGVASRGELTKHGG